MTKHATSTQSLLMQAGHPTPLSFGQQPAHRPEGGRITGTDVRTNPRTHPRRREPVAASMRTAAGGPLRTRALPTTSPHGPLLQTLVREPKRLKGGSSSSDQAIRYAFRVQNSPERRNNPKPVPAKPPSPGTPPPGPQALARGPSRRAQRCRPKARASTVGNIRDWKVTSTISYFFPGGTGGPPGRGLVPQVPKVCLV